MSDELGDDGRTWFLRCGSCHALFVPAEGLVVATGRMAMMWVRPRSRRKPTPCSHVSVERWDGTQWIGITTRPREA